MAELQKIIEKLNLEKNNLESYNQSIIKRYEEEFKGLNENLRTSQLQNGKIYIFNYCYWHIF